MKILGLCFLVVLMNVSLKPSSYAETNAATIPAIPPGVKLSTLETG
jgi:hypothetical protein